MAHDNNPYKQTTLKDRTKTYVHRKVWMDANGPIPKGMHIHHINGNKHDNRLDNLAMLTPRDNNRKYDKTGGKGYSYKPGYKLRPYRATKHIDGKQYSLGMYGTPCGAYMANRMAYITTG